MNQRKRHTGIDLMRVLCMLMIIQYHMQGHGGLTASTQLSPLNHTLIVILQSVYQAAVDGFALITGYVGYTSRHRYSSLALLWLRVLFYSVGITALMWLVSPASVSWTEIGNSFIPLLKRQYWYFTAYVGCFVLAPFVRAAIEHLSRREAKRCLGGVILVFSVLPYVLHNDPFFTSNGNQALWLLILYALGAYVKKYDPLRHVSVSRLALLLAGACALQAGAGFVLRPLSQLVTGNAVTQWYFICNDSPTTVLVAVLALIFFARLHPRLDGRLWKLIVSASFSVYLIHDHPLFRRRVIIPLGAYLASLPSALVIPCVFAAALIIYLLSTGIDALRSLLFDLLHIGPLLRKAEDKLLSRPESEEG